MPHSEHTRTRWVSQLAMWLLMCLPVTGKATHLVGGELTYEYQGMNAAGQHLFEVHCYIYRDCGPANTNQTGFDANAVIGIYQGSTLISTASGPLDLNLISNIVPQNPNNCAFLPEGLCIERAEYIIDLALEPSQIPYTLVHQRCCRSPSITNLQIPQDQGFSLTTVIPGDLTLSNPNSSPVFNELPQAFICNNYPFELDNSASDLDGDSLSYSLCPIYLGGSFMEPIPIPPTGPPFTEVGWAAGFDYGIPFGPAADLTINPVSGMLTGIPQLVGKFAIGVCVTEWRNGQPIGSILRDFTLDVVTCDIQSPIYVAPEPCSGMTVAFDQLANPSEAYTWDFGVAGTDDDVSNVAEPTYTYDEPGVYEVSLYFETGTCSDELLFELTVHEPWETVFSIDNVVCNDGGWSGQINLDTSAWTNFMNWQWEFGENSEPPALYNAHPDWVWFPQDESAMVTLNVVAFTCNSTFEVPVQFPSLPTAAFEILSEPCSGLLVEFDNLSPESGPFSWDFGGGGGLPNNEVNPVFEYPAYGTYQVTLTAGAGSECPDTQSQIVEVLPAIPFDSAWSIQPLALCEETGYMLLQYLGTGADEITWNFPGIVNSNEPLVEAFFPNEGSFPGTITLYNAYCDVEQTWDLEATVPPALEVVTYWIPNVISPNNDAQNDEFSAFILGLDGSPIDALDPGQFHQYQLRIFNRWGNEVFSTNQAGRAWRPGKEVSEGTYYYILKAFHVCDVEPFEASGEVTVVR